MSHHTEPDAGPQPKAPPSPPAVTAPPSPAKPPNAPDRVPQFPEDRLLIKALSDPVLDALGHDPRSAYVEQYWVSVLGPSATLLLRRLANGLEHNPEGFELQSLAWAQELGLGAKGGKHGPFWRSVDRICRFGAAQRNGQLLTVRRHLPPLNRRQIERLPDHLRRAHDRWSEERLAKPRRQTISQWSARHDPASPGEDPDDLQAAS